MKTSDEMTEIVFRKMAAYELQRKKRNKKILYSVMPLAIILSISLTILISANFTNITTQKGEDNQNNIPQYSVIKEDYSLYEENTTPTIYIEKKGHDFSFPSDIYEMIDEAEVIVIGKYESFNSTWNIADTTLDEKAYIEGHIFNFTVTDVLKGEVISEEIKVNHKYSERVYYNDTYCDFEDPLYSGPYRDAIYDNTYMLFLKKNNKDSTVYDNTESFMVRIRNNKTDLLSRLTQDTGILSSTGIAENGDIVTMYYVGERKIQIDNISGFSIDEIKDYLKGD